MTSHLLHFDFAPSMSTASAALTRTTCHFASGKLLSSDQSPCPHGRKCSPFPHFFAGLQSWHSTTPDSGQRKPLCDSPLGPQVRRPRMYSVAGAGASVAGAALAFFFVPRFSFTVAAISISSVHHRLTLPPLLPPHPLRHRRPPARHVEHPGGRVHQ